MFRTWIHANKVASSGWDSKELRRDLCTSLGTTKWQVVSVSTICYICVVMSCLLTICKMSINYGFGYINSVNIN